jgi:hypothetical protein
VYVLEIPILSEIVIGDEVPGLVFPEEEITVNPVIGAPPSAPAVNATDTTAVLAYA